MEVRKLKNHKNAQANVIIEDDGTISLISYKTEVVRCEPRCGSKHTGEYHVYVPYVSMETMRSYAKHGDRDDCSPISTTTAQHMSWFLAEYFTGVSYYDLKNSFKTGEVFTGRLVKEV